MSSGMTGQTPCLSSRWDKPAPPNQTVDGRQQGGRVGTPVAPNNSEPDSFMSDGERSAPEAQGGAAMAAAMAAKINAMLMAKGKLLTPPPLLAKAPQSVPMSSATEETVVTEVDINDVPMNSRDLLTKGKTQEEIRLFSGAVVSTKGHYMADTEKGKAGERPLYLHVQGKNQDQVNKAVLRIKEIISEDVLRMSAASGGQQVPVIPPLTLYPQPPRPANPSPMPRMTSNNSSNQGHRPAAPHSGSFVHTKIFVGLDQALPSFNVNEKVEGPGGTYLGHIQTETGARVFLRGKTSGYIEQASRRESFEPLYVYISHPNAAGLESAKKLTESLLETVRAEHSRMVSIYTATGSTQSYAAGFQPNSNYSNQGSWYNYSANGYAGSYSAYPGAGGYWSNANGPPSHSNLSTNPQSSQAMVQYPVVCPRKPHPYMVQDPGNSGTVAPEEPSPSTPESGSPKRHFQEEAGEEQLILSEPPSKEKSPPPAAKIAEEKGTERVLMPPPPRPMMPPPPPPAMPTATRKRQRETAPVSECPAAQPSNTAPMGVLEEVREKKSKVGADMSGLVPYGGDSSDEEEERTRSSKNS